MIAMQYSFTLPADYDMAIIDRRIRDKGPMLDRFPNLGFKAYLTARKDELGATDNLYAPFYLWRHAEGASDFLCGPGFEAVSRAFGRPKVATWIVWYGDVAPDVAKARFATREVLALDTHVSLAAVREKETARARERLAEPDMFASVAAFDPYGWTMVRFALHSDVPSITSAETYSVGHVSLP
ncbi:DUF4865 family protein [Rhizobium sp. S152]|uniref:DUF4865 family protein n=1 Tax=Rhizobium sp. S152 TaxID=3055038 RepID=UPI0025A9909F|nr:DUF4865 family protein [Rhizobium sp. S152]MDM9625856.1 DUF4865 family protein [Rhizobium sp. S152]